MKMSLVFAIGCLCVLVFGCSDHKESDLIVDDVKEKISHAMRDLTEGRPGPGLHDARQRLSVLIGGVSNDSQRVALANMYATELLKVDLTTLPHRYRADAAHYYFDRLEDAVRILKESGGVSSGRLMDVLFNGMAMFRETCLGVPLSGRASDEDRTNFGWRYECAIKLYDEYAQRMSEIRRFWLQQPDLRLPDDVHEEFRSRIKPFLDFPSAAEFRSAPMFGGCGVRNIVSPVLKNREE